MAGSAADPNAFLRPGYIPPKPPSTLFGDPNSFSDANKNQTGDYDAIMSQYKNLLSSAPISPVQYNGSPDITKAMANLSDLSQTGGYSDAGIADLRSRGVSPIRAVYANAQRDAARQQNLSGGYSPNAGAVSSKMAREQADLTSQRTTDVNAGIAQNVATNRIAAASPYATLASGEAGRGLDVQKFNADLINQNLANKNRALEGMRSLYGTTPALTDMFGKQIDASTRLGQNQQDINNRQQQNKNNIFLGASGR